MRKSRLLLSAIAMTMLTGVAIADTKTPEKPVQWWIVNYQHGECRKIETVGYGVKTPSDFITVIRAEGVIVQPTRSGNGEHRMVALEVTLPDNTEGGFVFFNNLSDCHIFVAMEIKAGDIQPPNDAQ